jgi:hypothetical protein
MGMRIAIDVSVSQRGIMAVVLLVGLLSVSEVPCTAYLLVQTPGAHRVSRRNRLAQLPSEHSSNGAVLVSRNDDRAQIPAAKTRACVVLNIPAPALTLSRSFSQFRSPPRLV